MIKTCAIALALIVTSFPVFAEWTGFIGYADGAHDGLETAIGYRHEARSRTALAVYPLQVVIYSADPPEGYREETFSNGNTACRDLSNGQFADKENCESGVDFEYTPSLELTQSVGSSFAFGAGYRGGDEANAYGVVNAQVSEKTHVGIRGGSEYLGVFVGAHF